jgi:enoyl-CoA hydratase/carnithine racemase
MSTTGDLARVDHPGWLELRLNRPAKLNALSPDLLFNLATELGSVADAHVVVLTGSGEKAFSAGFDLDVLRALGAAAHDGDPLGAAVAALLSCPVPTVAALHGYCWGAAVELVTACDIRIATGDTSIAIPSNRLGSLYRPRGIDALARRFGPTVVSELMIIGTRYKASTAVDRGLVSAVVEDPAGYCDTLAAALAPPAPGQHARFLREWVAAASDDREAVLARWQAVREASMAARVIPATGSQR